MPALIIRRLAVHPEALEWVWRSARPLMECGALQAVASSLMDAIPVASTEGLRLAAQVLSSTDPQRSETVRSILRTYNRVNPINLFVVQMALHNVTSTARGQKVPMDVSCAPSPLPAIPEPIPVADMEPDTRELVLLLGSFIPSSEEGRLVPTMYRHLARWPTLLASVAPEIYRRLDDGTIPQIAGHFSSEAKSRAAELAASSPAVPLELTPQLKDFVARACAPFLVSIPQLAVVGKMLELSLFPERT